MSVGFVNILLGTVLLAAGQKLFWLFVAAVGFWAGFNITPFLFFGASTWQLMFVGLVGGLLGLLSAIFLQGAAIILTGFMAGTYIFFSITRLLGWGGGYFWWVFLFLNGIMGSVLLTVFFNPALIVITALTGAMLIVQDIPYDSFLKVILLSCLFVLGLFIQLQLFYDVPK